MKAWLLDRVGDGISKLRLGDTVEPTPAPDEIVLKLLAASLNPADRYLAEGQYRARPTFPHVLGRDGVGIVHAVGNHVDPALIGKRRIILPSEIGVDRAGTFAERVALPLDYTLPAADDWSDEQCAAAPLVYLTAWQALTQWGELPPGIVLISGASGGVGVASIQLAGALGHTVIALSRNSEKTERLRVIGAAQVLSPDDSDWPRQLLDATGKKRVNLAIDTIGGPLFSSLLDTLAPGGAVSVVGRLAGPVPDFNTAALLFRRLKIGGVIVTGYTAAERPHIWNAILRKLPPDVRPVVDSVYPFSELLAAFDRLKTGPFGKVILSHV